MNDRKPTCGGRLTATPSEHMLNTTRASFACLCLFNASSLAWSQHQHGSTGLIVAQVDAVVRHRLSQPRPLHFAELFLKSGSPIAAPLPVLLLALTLNGSLPMRRREVSLR
jgi:hypothetical protein